MRLKILTSGYDFGTKVLFAFIQLVSRQPTPDAARLVFYRPDFYGAPMKGFTHLAMRGPSTWSVGDRELMAAFVSKMNACAFCIERTRQPQRWRIRTKRKFRQCLPIWRP